MTDTKYHAIHAYLSIPSRDAWEAFAIEAGCSITGLVEAMGHTLKEDLAITGGPIPEKHRLWVRTARRVDADRRRRDGRRRK